jgi:hypothetical protein
MNDSQKLQFLLAKLQEKANETHCRDEDDLENDLYYNPSYGGNFDDAFDDGEYYGEVEYARHLLALLTDK